MFLFELIQYSYLTFYKFAQTYLLQHNQRTKQNSTSHTNIHTHTFLKLLVTLQYLYIDNDIERTGQVYTNLQLFHTKSNF